ncbi:MAG: IS21 family transposase [Firmicutes bacterium]|nr:IS21 family transposase [Bacillota bacterium]
MTYEKIQEMKRNHLTKSQASRRLGIDRKTVAKYWDMPPEDFAEAQTKSKKRKKKADEYRSYVVSCLQKYPDMTAAQLYDWILEKTGKARLPFGQRSFRSYVNDIRKEYEIEKPENTRQYEAVEDLPMGAQAQVDMGEISLETPSGRHKKVYGFGMVMSHSRHKFILWQERPFTTATFVQAHINAFEFFGGRPIELVYDQDKVLAVSENNGDIIYTEGFQSYQEALGFDIFLCHGSDPESKGRIEAVIKYAKNNFARHRILTDIDSFNEDCIAWLARTGNAKEHETTKKIPAEVFEVEKKHLIPVPGYSFAKPDEQSIPHQVRKDNTVLYKGNRYRVPVGTYRKGKQVHLIIDEDMVSIIDVETGVLYAKHPLCTGKGELIGESSRRGRDKSKTILQLESDVKELFCGDTMIDPYLVRIHREKTRYYRDQLGVIRQLFDEWDADLIRKALAYCVEHEIYSAGELKSAVAYVSTLEDEKENKPKAINPRLPIQYRGDDPILPDLSIYEEAMERRVVNG